jgi:hypothetical protein
MLERHGAAFPEVSDHASVKSVLSSAPGRKVFPDIWVSARLGDTAETKHFMAKLDTGADQCIISEHVVANRWGLDRIDSSKKCVLGSLSIDDVQTMGQIRLVLRLRPKDRAIDVPFQVIPNSFVRYRFDALLSGKLIKRRNILVSGAEWKEAEIESEDDG